MNNHLQAKKEKRKKGWPRSERKMESQASPPTPGLSDPNLDGTHGPGAVPRPAALLLSDHDLRTQGVLG